MSTGRKTTLTWNAAMSNTKNVVPTETKTSPIKNSVSAKQNAAPIKGVKKRNSDVFGRYWQITVNNYTPADLETAKCNNDLLRSLVCYAQGCTEIAPTTGTPHIHVWIQGLRNIRRSKLIQLWEAHGPEVQRTVGSIEQNEAYVTSNEATERWEWGVRQQKKQGNRVDLEGIRTAVFSGKPMIGLVDQFTSPAALRWAESLMKYQPAPPDRLNLRVHWFYGTSGVGKTRIAMAEARTKGPVFKFCDTAEGWWDGYSGQKYVVIDELREYTFKPTVLLSLLDIYPVRVNIKGSSAWFIPDEIWVTSPMKPEEVFCDSEEKVLQLLRRIHDIRKIVAENTPKVADTSGN